MDLSIIIPAYNEELNLPSTLRDIADYLKTQNYNYEIIIVDDGSTDRSAEIASSMASSFDRLVLLKNNTNSGKGYSIKKGVMAAKGGYILFMDADNSTRIEQLQKLMSALEEGYSIAMGSRNVPGSELETQQPIYRRILGNIYILLSKIIVGVAVEDYNCGFKLYTKEAANLLFPKLTMSGWSFDSELIFLISKFKLKVKEVPVRWADKASTSKVKPLRDGINSFTDLIKIRINALKKIYD